MAISLLEVIRKDSSIHMHGLVVYVKKGLPFAWDLSLENFCRFSNSGFTSLSISLFFLYQSPCLSLCKVFDSISSNIDEILSINSSANVIIFGAFNIHHKDWLTYFGETDRSGKLL